MVKLRLLFKCFGKERVGGWFLGRVGRGARGDVSNREVLVRSRWSRNIEDTFHPSTRALVRNKRLPFLVYDYFIPSLFPRGFLTFLSANFSRFSSCSFVRSCAQIPERVDLSSGWVQGRHRLYLKRWFLDRVDENRRIFAHSIDDKTLEVQNSRLIIVRNYIIDASLAIDLERTRSREGNRQKKKTFILFLLKRRRDFYRESNESLFIDSIKVRGVFSRRDVIPVSNTHL